MCLKNEFKRINRKTGKPFEQGYQDENGRIFTPMLKRLAMMDGILRNGKKI